MEGVPGVDEQLGDGRVLISNRIFKADARQPINLFSEKLLSLSEYRPPKGRFPGGCLKVPGGTFLIFKSGKVVINGVKDEEPDTLHFTLITDIYLYDVKMSHCSAHARFGKVNLEQLQKGSNGVYEPELHPGLLFKINNVSVIVYHTGTVMLCGCKSVDHANNVMRNVREMINNVNK